MSAGGGHRVCLCIVPCWWSKRVLAQDPLPHRQSQLTGSKAQTWEIDRLSAKHGSHLAVRGLDSMYAYPAIAHDGRGDVLTYACWYCVCVLLQRATAMRSLMTAQTAVVTRESQAAAAMVTQQQQQGPLAAAAMRRTSRWAAADGSSSSGGVGQQQQLEERQQQLVRSSSSGRLDVSVRGAVVGRLSWNMRRRGSCRWPSDSNTERCAVVCTLLWGRCCFAGARAEPGLCWALFHRGNLCDAKHNPLRSYWGA